MLSQKAVKIQEMLYVRCYSDLNFKTVLCVNTPKVEVS